MIRYLTVVGKSPALAGIGKLPHRVEAVLVVDEAGMVLPGELGDLVAVEGDAFAVVLVRKVVALDDLAGLQVYLAQRGTPFDAGAFVQVAVLVDKALCPGSRVMRIGRADLIGIGRDAPVCREGRLRDQGARAARPMSRRALPAIVKRPLLAGSPRAALRWSWDGRRLAGQRRSRSAPAGVACSLLRDRVA